MCNRSEGWNFYTRIGVPLEYDFKKVENMLGNHDCDGSEVHIIGYGKLLIHLMTYLSNGSGEDEELFKMCKKYCDVIGVDVPPKDAQWMYERYRALRAI